MGKPTKLDDRRYTKRGPGPTAQSVIDRLRNDSEVPFVDVAAEFRISRERVRQIARDFMGETGVNRINRASYS